MNADSKYINEISLENARGLIDWYSNRAKLAQKYGDVTEFHYLKYKELYYQGLVTSIENKLAQKAN